MKWAISLLVAAAMVASANGLAAASDNNSNLHWVAKEVRIAGVLDELLRHSRFGFIAVEHVNVVDPVAARTIPDQTIIIRGSKIAWVGDASAIPDITGADIIDGRGFYLSPGLTDMHVHTESLSEQVLRLATGNTSVRDMDGFPWMLELRRGTEDGDLLAPTEYIAGTIIADHPLDGYAVVVHSAEEARQTVRNQAACGYDFIKVHNLLSQPLFDAIANEAQKAHLDLIGHIPHDISIDHALHVGHMRTVEHLKGFLLDRTLMVSTEDYEKATSGIEYWQVPTLYTYLGQWPLHGAAATAQQALPEMQYVAVDRRVRWAKASAEAADKDDKLRTLLVTAQHAAVDRLLPLHPHWLAGTDAAGYDYNVAGYALLDELDLMVAFHIPEADVLRAATSEPALAMRRNDFGKVERPMRADLVLLAADPTKDIRAFRNSRGVVVRGRWLDRPSIDAALASLAKIEAEPDSQFSLTRKAARFLIAAVEKLASRHIVLDHMHLNKAAAELTSVGYKQEAVRAKALAEVLQAGPCREITPEGSD